MFYRSAFQLTSNRSRFLMAMMLATAVTCSVLGMTQVCNAYPGSDAAMARGVVMHEPVMLQEDATYPTSFQYDEVPPPEEGMDEYGSDEYDNGGYDEFGDEFGDEYGDEYGDGNQEKKDEEIRYTGRQAAASQGIKAVAKVSKVYEPGTRLGVEKPVMLGWYPVETQPLTKYKIITEEVPIENSYDEYGDEYSEEYDEESYPPEEEYPSEEEYSEEGSENGPSGEEDTQEPKTRTVTRQVPEEVTEEVPWLLSVLAPSDASLWAKMPPQRDGGRNGDGYSEGGYDEEGYGEEYDEEGYVPEPGYDSDSEYRDQGAYDEGGYGEEYGDSGDGMGGMGDGRRPPALPKSTAPNPFSVKAFEISPGEFAWKLYYNGNDVANLIRKRQGDRAALGFQWTSKTNPQIAEQFKYYVLLVETGNEAHGVGFVEPVEGTPILLDCRRGLASCELTLPSEIKEPKSLCFRILGIAGESTTSVDQKPIMAMNMPLTESFLIDDGAGQQRREDVLRFRISEDEENTGQVLLEAVVSQPVMKVYDDLQKRTLTGIETMTRVRDNMLDRIKENMEKADNVEAKYKSIYLDRANEFRGKVGYINFIIKAHKNRTAVAYEVLANHDGFAVPIIRYGEMPTEPPVGPASNNTLLIDGRPRMTLPEGSYTDRE